MNQHIGVIPVDGNGFNCDRGECWCYQKPKTEKVVCALCNGDERVPVQVCCGRGYHECCGEPNVDWQPCDCSKTPGRLAYEEDVRRQPTYWNGSPRKTWEQLPNTAKTTWHENPTPRAFKSEKQS